MPSIFPFVANKTRTVERELEHYLSEPYNGSPVGLVRGTLKKRFSLIFTTRSQAEYDAAEAFHAANYPLTTITFRDYRYYPARDINCRFVSPFREQGSDSSGRFNYSFDLLEV